MKITNNFLLLPNTKLFVKDILIKFNKTSEEISKTIDSTGINSIFCSKIGMTKFISEGINIIKNRYDQIFNSIDAIIVVSQTYDERIPSISSRIQRTLKLKSNTFCVDIMDGCSGFIKALKIAKLLEENGYLKIMIVSGDLNSQITKLSDIGTKILFGDGVAITILETSEDIMDIQLYNHGDIEGVISCSSIDNVMNMNGFEVFRFTRNIIPKFLKEFLVDIDRDFSFFDLIALHQASKLVVNTICSSLNIKNSLTKNFACNQIGNIGAGSIGAWLTTIDNLSSSDKMNMLAVGFGSGLSWGAASILVNVDKNEVVNV